MDTNGYFSLHFRALLLSSSWLFRHSCLLVSPTHMEYKGEIAAIQWVSLSVSNSTAEGVGVPVPPYRDNGLTGLATKKEIFLP
jgi:hypothetical protein